MAVINLKTRKLALNVRRLRRELERRQLEVDQRWYDVLSLADLESLANEYDVETPSPRALEVAQLMEKLMADGVSTPADLKRALYGDEIKAIQAPIVQPVTIQEPIVQPMPQAIETTPVIEAPVKPVSTTPAGLIKARFVGALASGSLNITTIDGVKPLVKDETYTMTVDYWRNLQRLWPASWWTVES